MGLPKPENPLISLVNLKSIVEPSFDKSISMVYDFYSISLKRYSNIKLGYGQQESESDEGTLFFTAPGQILHINIDNPDEVKVDGRILFVHPDMLWNTSLAKTIKKYDFFDYSANEALLLSEKEESLIIGLLQDIAQEYSNIDNYSEDIIIAQLELLLAYADRFYHRQFLTRKKYNHRILNHVEELLNLYFREDIVIAKGLPTVQYISQELNISPCYLSRLLKTITGQTTQQLIQEKIITIAKEKLTTTDLSVSEIAYELGFEHSQSFNKFFKVKTQLSPLEFRRLFN
jgi:AraC-like DNA-binding protein